MILKWLNSPCKISESRFEFGNASSNFTSRNFAHYLLQETFLHLHIEAILLIVHYRSFFLSRQRSSHRMQYQALSGGFLTKEEKPTNWSLLLLSSWHISSMFISTAYLFTPAIVRSILFYSKTVWHVLKHILKGLRWNDLGEELLI